MKCKTSFPLLFAYVPLITGLVGKADFPSVNHSYANPQYLLTTSLAFSPDFFCTFFTSCLPFLKIVSHTMTVCAFKSVLTFVLVPSDSVP